MPSRDQAGSRRAITLGVVVLVAAAGVVGIALYQEAIGSYFAQQGWNPGAAESIVRDFIRAAREPGGGEAAARLVDTDRYEPVIRAGRLVELRVGGGMERIRVDQCAPTTDVRRATADLRVKEGGGHRVLVQFANGKWAEYRVRRKNGAPQIVDVPASVLDAQPPRNPNDY